MALYHRILAICIMGALLLSGCTKQQHKRPALTGMSKSKLASLNLHYNHLIRYQEDSHIDYWQTPGETLRLRSGDCEDISIAKMHDPALRYAFPADQIRLSYVHTPDGQPHMVLFVGSGSDVMVMDNLHDRIMTASASGYTPVYQLDANGRVYQDNIWLETHPGFKKYEAILASL